MMQVVDEFYSVGKERYAESLFAAGHFERIIVDAISSVMDTKMEKLAAAFGLKKLDGGGVYRNRPSVEQMQNLTTEGFWAWLGKDYWMPEPVRSSCFVGLLINEGRSEASIMFRNNRSDFRERLAAALTKNGLVHYQQYGETVFHRPLEGNSLDSFCHTLDEMVVHLVRAVDADGYFRSSDQQE